MIRFFIQKDIASIKNFLKKNNSRKLVALAFILIIGLFVASLYIGSLKFFEFLNTFTDVGRLVGRVILGYSVFIVFILMIPSYLFSSLMTSFYDKSYAFIMTSPVNINKVFRAAYLKSYLIGLWPVLIIGVPLLLSYSIAFNHNLFQILLSLDILIAMSFICYGLGFLISILLQNTGLIKYRLFWVITAIGLVLVLPRFISSLVPEKLHKLYYAPDLIDLNQQINQLPVLKTYLPSTWVTNTIAGSYVLPDIIALYVLSISIIVISYIIGKKVFHTNWQLAQENNFIASNQPTSNYHSMSVFSRKSLSAGLIARFITSFTRSTSQVANIMFLFILAVISIYLLQNLAPFRDTTTPYYKNLITFAFMTISFIITIICLKFIFPLPQYNLRDHLVISSPTPAAKLYKSFTLFGIICAIFFALVFSLPMIFSMHGIYAQFRIVFVVVSILTSLIISFLTLIIGTMTSDPNNKYNEDDITTSPNGIATTIISVLIISMIAMSLNNILNLAWTDSGVTEVGILMEIGPIVGILILMGIISWYGGVKLLKRKVSI